MADQSNNAFGGGHRPSDIPLNIPQLPQLPQLPQPRSQQQLYDPAISDSASDDDEDDDTHGLQTPVRPGSTQYSPSLASTIYRNQHEYHTYSSHSAMPVSPLPQLPDESYYNDENDPADAYAGQDEAYPLKQYPAPIGVTENNGYWQGQRPDDNPYGNFDAGFDPMHQLNVHGDSYPINTYDNNSEDYTDDGDTQDELDQYHEDQYQYESQYQNQYQDQYQDAPILVQDGYGPTTVANDEYVQHQYDNIDQTAVQNGNEIPPPGQQPRRQLSRMKKVPLYRQHLVLDCHVPKKLVANIHNPEHENNREFQMMRYTAATTTPLGFSRENYDLRQTIFTSGKRTTELFIVVTIYNEDDILLARTLKGVFENIYYLCKMKKSWPGGEVWGENGWKKVVVCVVADGREKLNPRAAALMSALGCYQDGMIVNVVDDKPVTAHVYEYTTPIGINITKSSVGMAHNSKEHPIFPVQMLFCVKEKNAKKINSHRWFFDAFSPILSPNVCVLLDAGTKPGADSLYHLWYEFYKDPSVGGACGEIRADLGKNLRNLINPLVAAQNFEYKMSNILDKPLESAFGFISVLPGAFSAYRYIALQNDPPGEGGQGPLEKYFRGETLHDSGADIFTANMYLAEDRILCYELVSKRGASWVLRYVKSAHAETDVPDQLQELIQQRRRWLNGSFFAALYSLTHAFNIWRSNHSFLRKIMLNVEFLYQLFSMLFSWFAVGNFFLVFRLLTTSLGAANLHFSPGLTLGVILEWFYIAALASCFVLAFGNRPQGTRRFYAAMVWFFALLMGYLIFAVIFVTVKAVAAVIDKEGILTAKSFVTDSVLRGIVVSLASTYILYFLSSFLFLEFGHMVHSFIQYLLISPSYINVLNVYAFCNIHDISWGTKGDTGAKGDVRKVKTGDKDAIKNALIFEASEIDERYDRNLEELQTKPAKVKEAAQADPEKKKHDDEEKRKDYYAMIRSMVVLLWMATNFGIVAVVLQTAGLSRLTESGSSNSADEAAKATFIADTYLQVVLWAVAAMALFRFLGSTYYLIARFFI
ncbi:chitin synthase-domain-containing protein [Lipomyces arxii]|uniref:chitin synthase-domain-containing protein n=1 Tax=Lipomyces arxii TaxID=56418 RepID=UPI0034CE07A4